MVSNRLDGHGGGGTNVAGPCAIHGPWGHKSSLCTRIGIGHGCPETSFRNSSTPKQSRSLILIKLLRVRRVGCPRSPVIEIVEKMALPPFDLIPAEFAAPVVEREPLPPTGV
jgi:hypothetical protein